MPQTAIDRSFFSFGSERFDPYRLHVASSTIQRTSAWKSMPAYAAISGTSDVAVMPGCVLTSRQINSSVPPGRSSYLKSARLTPRQPRA
jgi:hypothetical protein